MMTNLIPCPDCRSTGAITGFACSMDSGGSVRTLPCLRCKGESMIPSEMADWMRLGEALRVDRIREDCGGGERARMLGLTRLQLNDVEHGKVDPRSVLCRTE